MDKLKKDKQSEEDKEDDLKEEYPTSPYETDEISVYELDIRKFQKSYPEISLKQALAPFVEKGKFKRLII